MDLQPSLRASVDVVCEQVKLMVWGHLTAVVCMLLAHAKSRTRCCG